MTSIISGLGFELSNCGIRSDRGASRYWFDDKLGLDFGVFIADHSHPLSLQWRIGGTRDQEIRPESLNESFEMLRYSSRGMMVPSTFMTLLIR